MKVPSSHDVKMPEICGGVLQQHPRKRHAALRKTIRWRRTHEGAHADVGDEFGAQQLRVPDVHSAVPYCQHPHLHHRTRLWGAESDLPTLCQLTARYALRYTGDTPDQDKQQGKMFGLWQ